jgi:predicted secreted protein
MSGRTNIVVGAWHDTFVHVPISLATLQRNFKQHQRFTVSLPGNRTTGYNWEVVSAPGLSQQGEPEFFADSNATGAGGMFRYSFITASVGTGGLKMVYRRPWETGTAPLTSFEITAIITDW